jgi:hypothetical protein
MWAQSGNVEPPRRVPAGAIEQQDSVRALRGIARDFLEMELRHIFIGVGQRQRCAFAVGGTDRAELSAKN